MPDQAPPADETPKWGDAMTVSQRSFAQLGFAGLVALMFFMQYRDFASEAKSNREMYREEAHATRAEFRVAAETNARQTAALTGQVVELAHEMRRAVDVLRAAGLKIEKVAEKVNQEHGTTAPPPRVKGEEQAVPAFFRGFKGLP